MSTKLQVNITIANNTSISANLKDYEGNVNYTKEPTILLTNGATTEVYAYGDQELYGSFVLDFHPEMYKCSFQFGNPGQFIVEGSVGNVEETHEVARQGDTMVVSMKLADPKA